MDHFRVYFFSVKAGILFIILSITISACQGVDETHPEIELSWEIEPDPPGVGMNTLHITLTDSTNQPITGADIELEGNMSHPGMQPVFTTAEEIRPGEYSAQLEFTMGGDWFILLNSTLTDQRVVERQINISGVRTP